MRLPDAVSVVLGILATAVLANVAPAAAADDALGERFPETVITAEGNLACHRFAVWLALDHASRARGLMHVRELPPDRGMLFIYPGERRVSMWMKNTLIPLDMIFIRADETIANVARNTVPLSLESVFAAEPVQAVLEVNAGIAASLGLAPGRRIYVTQARRSAR